MESVEVNKIVGSSNVEDQSQHQPSSSHTEVTTEYEELLDDVNLAKSQKEIMRLYSTEKKQLLVSQYKEATEEQHTEERIPGHFLDYLENFLSTPTSDYSQVLECMESLKIALRSYTLSWMRDFGIKGLKMILSVLDLATKRNEERLEIACLKCILNFIDNTKGLEEFLTLENAETIIVNCLNYKKELVMIEAVKVLTVLSLLAPEKALVSISQSKTGTDCKQILSIVEGITMTNNVELWVSCLELINAILTQSDDSEFQTKIYDEVVSCGIFNRKDDIENQEPKIQELFTTFKNFLKTN